VNKQTWIWIGIGAAVAVGIYLLSKKDSIFRNAIPAPEKHSFAGTVNRNGTPIYLNADGGMTELKARMNQGEKVHIFAQADGYYKIDCDGIWINQNCVDVDSEFRNFTGQLLEPEQDIFSGQIRYNLN